MSLLWCQFLRCSYWLKRNFTDFLPAPCMPSTHNTINTESSLPCIFHMLQPSWFLKEIPRNRVTKVVEFMQCLLEIASLVAFPDNSKAFRGIQGWGLSLLDSTFLRLATMVYLDLRQWTRYCIGTWVLWTMPLGEHGGIGNQPSHVGIGNQPQICSS